MESNYQETLGAAKGQATLLVLFIPSVDRDYLEIEFPLEGTENG